jgi:hypothetical protein
VAAALAEEQLQGRLRIAPGLVATSSEVLTADMRRRIGQAFGLEPLDFYGTTEALVVAASRHRSCWRSASTRSSTTRPGCTWPSCCARTPRPTPRPGSGPPWPPSSGTPARSRPPIEVTPVPRIDRDPGHGAKFKLVRSRPAPSP